MHIRDLSTAARRMAIALLVQPQAILRWRPDRFSLTLAALSLLGAALILARQVNYGVGLDQDSVHYILVARHLLEGEGFVQLMNKVPYVLWSPHPMLLAASAMVAIGADGAPYWPPLYPLLLAAASFFVFDPYAVVGPLNAAIFGLTIAVAGQWLRQRIHSRFLILWTCLAILFALPLASWASTVMTDTPFVLFVTLALLQTDNFLQKGKQASLLWAAVFTALACLTRYIGPALIFTVLSLLLFQPSIALIKKLKRIGLYATVSATPICLWLLRNFLLSGNPMGGRDTIIWPFLRILDKVISHLTRWLFLDLSLGEFHVFAEALTGLALLVLVIALGVILRAQQKAAAWTDLTSLCLFPAFTLVYFILLILAVQTSEVGPKYRFMLPVYIPLLFTAVLVIDRFLRYERQRKLLGTINDLPFIRTIIPRRVKQVSLLTVLLSAVLSLWLGWSVPINARVIRQVNMPTSEVGSTYLQFADSQALQYMREHSIDGAIVSNLWQGVLYLPTTEYYFSDLMSHWPALTVAAPYSGRRADYHHIPSSGQWHRYVTRLFIGNTDDDVYLVWFYCGRQPRSCATTWFYGGFQTPNLDALPELELIAELEDGVILKVNKAYGNADAYRAITATQPLVRSNFNLHLIDNTLHYVRDTCRPDDLQARFFLHIVPHDTNDLPQHRQQYGFVNLDFAFYENGVRFDGKCLASVLLPDYPIVYIKTGQGTPNESLFWQGESIVNVNNDYGAEAYQSIVAGQAVLRAHFDIYLNDNSLHYVRDTCRPNDIQARFFLHILPHDTNDLPQHRQQYGFDNLDFAFYRHVVRFDGKCLASVPLPAYPIARINTGQWIRGEGKLWEGEFPFHEE